MDEAFVPEAVASHPTWFRLSDQLGWYDRKSGLNQRWFKRTRLAQLLLSTAIPFFSLAGEGALLVQIVPALLGGTVALLEGVQQLYQFGNRWFEYRATAEMLTHEKFLFLAGGGPYRDLAPGEALRLLAERIEEAVSQEHARWVQSRPGTEKGGEEEEEREKEEEAKR
jgi:Protein of unknown function (DUF4231)